jgi:hypothetical protein
MMLQISHAAAIERLQKLVPRCQSLNPDDISSHAKQHGTSQAVKEYWDGSSGNFVGRAGIDGKFRRATIGVF